MQEKKSHNAKYILKNLKSFLGISTDVELANLLNIKPNTLSTWKQRNSVDFKLIIEAAQNNNLDLNKIFYHKELTKSFNLSTNYTPIVTKENIQQYINGELDERLGALPNYNFLLGESSKNIAFQVPTNRLAPEIPEESFAICDFSTLNKIDEHAYYVLISKKYGFFISRIKPINELDIELLDIQTTGKMKNYTLKHNNVSELWKVIGVSTYKPLE